MSEDRQQPGMNSHLHFLTHGLFNSVTIAYYM